MTTQPADNGDDEPDTDARGIAKHNGVLVLRGHEQGVADEFSYSRCHSCPRG